MTLKEVHDYLSKHKNPTRGTYFKIRTEVPLSHTSEVYFLLGGGDLEIDPESEERGRSPALKCKTFIRITQDEDYWEKTHVVAKDKDEGLALVLTDTEFIEYIIKVKGVTFNAAMRRTRP